MRQFEPFWLQAEKRLRILEAATALRDLAQLPSNRLEALTRRPALWGPLRAASALSDVVT